MKKLIFVLLALNSQLVNAFDIDVGIEAGQCSAVGDVPMCTGDGSPVWHLYASFDHHIASGIYLTGSARHYSRYDGRNDLDMNKPNETGEFNYIGVGLSYRFRL